MILHFASFGDHQPKFPCNGGLLPAGRSKNIWIFIENPPYFYKNFLISGDASRWGAPRLSTKHLEYKWVRVSRIEFIELILFEMLVSKELLISHHVSNSPHGAPRVHMYFRARTFHLIHIFILHLYFLYIFFIFIFQLGKMKIRVKIFDPKFKSWLKSSSISV